ncbi:hypothetical protein MCOR02_009388 [Pyricularia oryzae]|nr:hypothetical protein MCOR01_001778 [Pyricularia oryzae]KAH9429651.1 hypothetical protein MCOR02_009388 [Pyricularia oryzae]KAI6256618.1 hypothetical protein MCOR19_006931 [Pyricularia oryzae]KAI6347049.1 hypothetical protein MCOR30_000366 [Pyricularia oryzae]KAI6391366.1 hypothetical protein MCOR24_010167 [Pyricularia oryzae]
MLLPDPPTPHLLNRASYRSGGGRGLGVAGGNRGGGNKVSTGAIVGIVIGITALAAITLAVIGARRGWWCRQRRRKQVDESDSVSTDDMISPMSRPENGPDVASKDWKRKFTWGKRGDGDEVVAEPRAARAAV